MMPTNKNTSALYLRWPRRIATGLFLVAAVAHGQDSVPSGETELSLADLMNIEVEGVSKYKEKLSEAPMTVYSLSSEEMNRWGVRYLFEALQRTPGFSFYNTDYYGQYGVMARGWQSVWRYGFSIELMPMVDFGHHTFPSAFYKSVEIARGPAGLAWGSNANAGLLNIQLRDDLNGFETVAEVGNEGRQNYSLMVGRQIDKANGDGVFFGLNSMEQGTDVQQNTFGVPGQTYKTNGWQPSYAAVAKMKYKDIKVLFYHEQGLHVQPDMHWAPNYVQDSTGNWVKTPDRIAWDSIAKLNGHEPFDQMEMNTYRVEYKVPLRIRELDLTLYNNFYKRLWQEEGIADFGDRKRDIGFNLNFRMLDDRLITNIGGDLYSDFQMNSVAVNHPLPVELSEGSLNWWGSVSKPTTEVSHNLFGQVSYRVMPQLLAILGARVDYNEDAKGDKATFTGPRVGLVYSPLENLTAKYTYNRAPRSPISNEALTGTAGPEVLDAHELSVFWSLSDKVNANVTVYRQALTDQITRNPNTFNDFTNTGGLTNTGMEWALKGHPVKSVLVYANGSYCSPEIQSGDVPTTEPHTSGMRPLFVPSLSNTLGAEYSFGDLANLNVDWRTVQDIPYHDLNGNDRYLGVDFMDLTLRVKPLKLMRNAPVDLELAGVALNALDNRGPVPAYGEHAKNQNGTMEPESRRWYLKAKLNVPVDL